MQRTENRKNSAIALIFFAWLAYATSYLGKFDYSANITQIIDYYGVTKSQAGAAPTFFFFAYGIGQVVNGLLCKKYNAKWVVSGSLFVSALVNLLIVAGIAFHYIKWLWLINGFVLSALWPTLIRLLSESISQDKRGVSCVTMGTTTVGTFVIYGLSSLFALFNQFRLVFLTAAVADLVVAFTWVLVYGRIVQSAKNERMEKDGEYIGMEGQATVQQTEKNEDRSFFSMICVLCFCAVGVCLIKDGLTTWVPSILKETFSMSDSLSILLTLFLPALGIFGNAMSLRIHKKIPNYVKNCVLFFGIILVLLGLIIGCIEMQNAVCMVLGLIVSYFFVSSVNALFTSVFPLFLKGNQNSGMYAGVINGFCYVGSTISAYGLGVIAEHFNWMAVFYTLVGMCFLMMAVCTVYLWQNRKQNRSRKA